MEIACYFLKRKIAGLSGIFRMITVKHGLDASDANIKRTKRANNLGERRLMLRELAEHNL